MDPGVGTGLFGGTSKSGYNIVRALQILNTEPWKCPGGVSKSPG